MEWTLPNILTVFRTLAAPLVLIVFLVLKHPYSDFVALGLFIAASLTDYLDGYLARKWKQISSFGTMLDPIADKAMVIIAIATLIGLFGLDWRIALPGSVILLREVFVSGLREFLGDNADKIKVTKLAKWKTATQMTAIGVLLSFGLFQHYFGMAQLGMNPEIANDVLNGTLEDAVGLRWKYTGYIWSFWAGIVLFWIAAGLTLISGLDYLRKAMPFFKEAL
ncbi:MAG: CDP-diacylglycerol--glycerol-3-phosphate 3-phosphatidyltransferase [Pseudomonadota bacterium]